MNDDIQRRTADAAKATDAYEATKAMSPSDNDDRKDRDRGREPLLLGEQEKKFAAKSRIKAPAKLFGGGFRGPSVDPWEAKRDRAPRKAPEDFLIASLRMTRKVYRAIEKTIGNHPAEQGGMLLSSSGDYTITDYVFDASAATSGGEYNPNTDFLNRELTGRNDHFVGIVHSHPPGCRRLSGQDQRAAWSNLTSPGNPHLHAYLMPLVMTAPDTGRFALLPFIVVCHPRGDGQVIVREVPLEIIE